MKPLEIWVRRDYLAAFSDYLRLKKSGAEVGDLVSAFDHNMRVELTDRVVILLSASMVDPWIRGLRIDSYTVAPDVSLSEKVEQSLEIAKAASRWT